MMSTKGFFLGWRIVIIAFLVQMISSGTIFYSYSIVAVPLGAEFQSSRTSMMFGITAMALAAGLMSPLLGRAIDRHSVRAMMIAAALALPLGYLLLSFVTDIWQVPVIYGTCMAVAIVMLGPLAASALLARWFKSKLAFVMGISAVGTSLGGFLFPPLIEWMTGAFEWRTAFRLLALLILVLALPATLLVINRPQDKLLRAYGSSDTVAPTSTPSSPTAPSTFLKNRTFWLLAAVMSGPVAVGPALMSNLVPFAIDAGVSKEQGALLISIIAVCGAAGKLAFGAIADRMDLRAGLGAALLLLFTGLGFFLGKGLPMLVAGSVATGLASGGVFPVWSATMVWLFGATNFGRATGQLSLVLMPMGFISPLLTGGIYDLTGSYKPAFILLMVVLAGSVLLLPTIRSPAHSTISVVK